MGRGRKLRSLENFSTALLERFEELFSPLRVVSNATWRRVSPEFAGVGYSIWKGQCSERPHTEPGVQKPGYLRVFEPPHLYSVEPPGAKIRMFRFMRDVEPEDPMFLM